MFREMVRKKQQLSQEESLELLKKSPRGILSVLGDNGYPYGVPIDHWYNEDDGKIYFHCGNVGHRLESLQKDNKVSFCVYDKGFCKDGEWALNFKSVIVFGKIEIVEDFKTISEITTKLSHKFTQDDSYIKKEIEQSLHRTLLLVLSIEHICGKKVVEA
jgi:nitroimidazol reductase NimA-like FMN-containing flavoprotein (pyridoxamine 5'-phosphate oxidase superfamily)